MNLNYLFYDFRNEKGDAPAASIVPTFNMHNQGTVKSVDMSFLLRDWNENYENIFLTQEMQGMLALNAKEEIIALRKQLIMLEEHRFVTSLGLVYDDPNLSISNS